MATHCPMSKLTNIAMVPEEVDAGDLANMGMVNLYI